MCEHIVFENTQNKIISLGNLLFRCRTRGVIMNNLDKLSTLDTEMLATVEGGGRPEGAPVKLTPGQWACIWSAFGAVYAGAVAPITIPGGL